MEKKSKRKYKRLWPAALLLALALFFYWQNNGLTLTHTTYTSGEIPPELDGFTILQISDLHGKRFGKGQSDLMEMIRRAEPDIILLTGDLADRRRYDPEPALELVRAAAQIAPVYGVPGNHEAGSGQYETFRAQLAASGARMLENEALTLVFEEGDIVLLGLMDPGFFSSGYFQEEGLAPLENQLEAWRDIRGFTLLLSHRPELLPRYAEAGVDVVFSGHAHGGQFRFFGRGLYAPNQGLFPPYTGGSYAYGPTTMFVSRGLGNSVFPLRLFNRPEVVAVKLKAE